MFKGCENLFSSLPVFDGFQPEFFLSLCESLKSMPDIKGDFFIANGKLCPVKEAQQIEQMPGVTVYEILRVEKGVPLFLEDHLKRLNNSASLSGYSLEKSVQDIAGDIKLLIDKNSMKQGRIRLEIIFDERTKRGQRCYIFSTSYSFPGKEQYKRGVKTDLCYAIRQNPNAKLAYTDARRRADELIEAKNLFEVLLVTADNTITEGSRTNYFCIKEGSIITPPSDQVLNGISRMKLLEVMNKMDIPYRETTVKLEEALHAEAAFLTGTSIHVMPIASLADKMYDVQHPLLQKVQQAFQQMLAEYTRNDSH